jgi:hypothetical protein
MNFSDLSIRLETGIIVWVTLGFWIYLSMKIPWCSPLAWWPWLSSVYTNGFLWGLENPPHYPWRGQPSGFGHTII